MDTTFISYDSFKTNFETVSTTAPVVLNSTMLRDKKLRRRTSKKTKELEPESPKSPSQINGLQKEVCQRILKTAKSTANEEKISNKRKLIPLPSPYTCRECGLEFKRLESLRLHFMRHLNYNVDFTSQSPFKCRWKQCDKIFEQKRERKVHEKRHFVQLKQPNNLKRMHKMMENLKI